MRIFEDLRSMEQDISRRLRTPMEAMADAQAERDARARASSLRERQAQMDRDLLDFERQVDGSYAMKKC